MFESVFMERPFFNKLNNCAPFSAFSTNVEELELVEVSDATEAEAEESAIVLVVVLVVATGELSVSEVKSLTAEARAAVPEGDFEGFPLLNEGGEEELRNLGIGILFGAGEDSAAKFSLSVLLPFTVLFVTIAGILCIPLLELLVPLNCFLLLNGVWKVSTSLPLLEEEGSCCTCEGLLLDFATMAA